MDRRSCIAAVVLDLVSPLDVKGIAPAITDILGGHVHGTFADLPILLPHIKAGRLKPIGLVGTRRSAVAPEIPTLDEQGYRGVEGLSWYGILPPVRTPAAVVARLNEAIGKALTDPEVAEKLRQSGAQPSPSSSEDMAKLILSEQARWSKIVAEKKISAE